MKDLYYRLDDGSSKTNNWFVIMPIDYMRVIDETGVCQVMLKENTDNTWLIGLSALNSYTVDFKMDGSNNYFAITNEGFTKSWTETKEGF